MRRHIWLCLAAGLVVLPSLYRPVEATAATNQADPRMPRITVRLFDYVGLPAPIAKRAREEAGRIFKRAGVELRWVRCSIPGEPEKGHPTCQARPLPTDIQLNILTRPMARKMRTHHSEFGMAFPLANGFGNRASIFYHRVDELAERQGAPRALLLGHFIAHEIGHLLLGINSHSNSGLMRVPWNKAQREKAYLGTLLFAPEETGRIQRQAAARERTAQALAERAVSGVPTTMSRGLDGSRSECSH